MIVATLLAVWLVMLKAPATSTGRFLRRHIVERPALWLGRFGRGHILLLLLAVALGSVALWFGGGDGARMVGMAAPDMVAWATTFEVATYLDIIAALAMTASALRVRAIVGGVTAWVRPRCVRVGVRAPRARRTHAVSRPANDDGDADHRTRAA